MDSTEPTPTAAVGAGDVDDMDEVDDVDLDVALGREIRSRRLTTGISLRELARKTDLSPSFISQLERGLARPRITSLHRVARALGTTAQALLSSGEDRSYSLVRHRVDGRVVDLDEQLPGSVRSLVSGDRPLTAMEFRGLTSEMGEYYEHPGEELYLVVSGSVEVDLDGELIVLDAGDCLCYDGRRPHRSRSVGDVPALVYLITVRDDVRH